MKLQPYQESVLEKGDRPFALHGTGTGKTLTSLKFIERAQNTNPDGNVVLITSSALRDNLRKEKDKHEVDIDLDRVYTVTHEGMSRPNIAAKVKELVKDDGTLVMDEIHKIRNTSSKGYKNTMEASASASRALGLTGTGIINHPDDLSALYGLVQGEKVADVSDFIEEKVNNPSLIGRLLGKKPKVTLEISDAKSLKDNFKSLDIYYPPEDNPHMPTVLSRVEEVEMPATQVLAYSRAEGQAIKGRKDLAELARKIRKGERLSKTEAVKTNVFASQTSQAAISSAKHLPGPPISGKIKKAVNDLHRSFRDDDQHRAVLYTNKIGAGIEPLIKELNYRGLDDKYQVVQGSTDKSEIQGLVDNYNCGEKPILILSDAGAEGLDLKGTRSIQVLNPHFNDGKINQAIGRGARHGSHAHLPKNQRSIEVTHYHSVFPRKWMIGGRDKTVDGGLHALSMEKAKKRDLVISVLSNDH